MLSRSIQGLNLTAIVVLSSITFGGVALAQKPSNREIKAQEKKYDAAQKALTDAEAVIADKKAHLDDPEPAKEDVDADCNTYCVPGKNPKCSGTALDAVGIRYTQLVSGALGGAGGVGADSSAGNMPGSFAGGGIIGGTTAAGPYGNIGDGIKAPSKATPLCVVIYNAKTALEKVEGGAGCVTAAMELCGPVKRRVNIADLMASLTVLKRERDEERKILSELRELQDCDDCVTDNGPGQAVNTGSQNKRVLNNPLGDSAPIVPPGSTNTGADQSK